MAEKTTIDVSPPEYAPKKDPELKFDRESDKIITERINEQIRKNPNMMPKAVWFIIPNEFAERFCFYGISPILKNFLNELIGFGSASAKSWVHIFKVMSYFFPLLGSMISDSFLGKYHTIVSLSICYVIGVALLAISAVPSIINNWLPILGLVVVALGTGGIKPCVSSHGGDQFIEELQQTNLNRFYNYFYMAINVGAVISGFVTPSIAGINLYGKNLAHGDGYSWAFAVCAIVMALAVAVFVFGHRYYRVVPPTKTFILWDLLRIAGTAFPRFISASKEERAAKRHWAAFADDVLGPSMADETYDVFAVLLPLLPVPFFWMAFDQNGTSWQDQGFQMQPAGFFNDEIASAVINPFWIVVLVPFFSYFIYPTIEKKFPAKFGMLQRMSVGMFFAGFSFVICALIQIKIDNSCTVSEDGSSCRLESMSVFMQMLPYLVITIGEVLTSVSGLNLLYNEVGTRTKASGGAIWLLTVSFGNLMAAALFESLAPASNYPGAKLEGWSYTNFYWLNAGLLFGAGILQVVLASMYTYRADRPWIKNAPKEVIAAKEPTAESDNLLPETDVKAEP